MLLFMDGQAHYSSAQIARKYSTLTDTATTWTVATDGRFGHCLKRVSASAFSGESAMLTIAPLMTRSGVWTPKTSGVAGFALKVDDLEALADSSIAYNSTLIKIAEGASYHCRVNLNPAGTFTLIQNIGSAENSSGATILAHSVGGIAGGSWAYLEFKWDLDGGSFEIRVNGSTVLDYTGTITENELLFNSLGVWNGIKILGITSQATPLLTLRMADLYLADLESADADDVSDFLGDGTIETIRPNAAGAASAWTPSAGSNYQNVDDDAAADDDATYNSTTAPNTIDSYNFENLPAGSVVNGVHVNILARKAATGSAAIAPVYRQGGVNYVGPTQGVASEDYDRYVMQPMDLNPATSAKFTESEINANEFGVKKVI